MKSSTAMETIIKFLYSYGGKITPRPSDGKLRYVGGCTRVLSVDRFVTYSELMVKFGESCGSSMNLTCKLPSEDLDVLISIKSDEDLKSVIEEYEKASPEVKIRVVLFPIKSAKKVSPPSFPMSCFDFPSAPKQHHRVLAPSIARYYPAPKSYQCSSPAVGYPVAAVGKYHCFEARSPMHFYQIEARSVNFNPPSLS